MIKYFGWRGIAPQVLLQALDVHAHVVLCLVNGALPDLELCFRLHLLRVFGGLLAEHGAAALLQPRARRRAAAARYEAMLPF